ncbi:MAG: ABC transporter ATP-binding protein [Clostridium sp.]|nr:ABC transporter ATP-binding protein [Clostridium sp.]
MKFEVKNGCFSYGKGKEILHDISFEVTEGKVLSILGPNGVGKTTLLRSMMGLLEWKSGGTYLNGVNIKTMKDTDLWKTIAYVPQAKGVAFSYTLEEMVLMGRSAYVGSLRQPTKEDLEICHDAMNMLKIYHLKDKFCNAVSGGELQMALIARALCAEPSMLVLDEPESNLDFKNQLIILETIEKLAKEKNISCIFNTHYPVHALKVSDSSLILSRDGTTRFGKTKDVISPEIMREVFEVDVHINDVTYGDLQYQTVTALSIV